MRYAHDDIDVRMNASERLNGILSSHLGSIIEMIEWDVKGQDELALDIPPSKICNTQGECQQECCLDAGAFYTRLKDSPI